MKTVVDTANNRTIRLRCGKDEVSLPDLGDDVEVTYYAANNLIEIRQKSWNSSKLIRYGDTDALVAALTAPPPEQQTKQPKQPKQPKSNATTSEQPKQPCKESKPCDYSGILPSVTAAKTDDSNSKAADIADIGTTVDAETGEVMLSRNYDGLRRSYNRQRRQVLNCACWSNMIWTVCTVDTKPTYKEMNKLTTAFIDCAEDHYGKDEIKNFIFLEPCEDGSWHLNDLIYFRHGVPAEFFEDDNENNNFISRWWGRKNKKKCDEQVKIFTFLCVDDLLRVLDYLNPTSKDKRNRIKYYEKGSQPMRCRGGNITEPHKVIAAFETAQTIVSGEKVSRRKSVEIEQTDTGFMLFSFAEFLFEANPNLFAPRAEDTSTTSDSDTADVPKTNDDSGGKVDYFHCADEESGACVCRTGCDKHGKCEYCFGYSTSFCRGCIWDDDN